MSDENALHLPEIRSLIGRHLSRSDIKSCSLVCRSWQATFARLLWRDTTIRARQNGAPYALTPLRPQFCSRFRTSAHLVRSLEFEGGPASLQEVYLGAYCRRLEHLRIRGTAPARLSSAATAQNVPTRWGLLQDSSAYEDSGDVDNEIGLDAIDTLRFPCTSSDSWGWFADLVRQNRRTLRTLDITLMNPPPAAIPTREFWDAVISCFPIPTALSSSSSTRLTSLCMTGRDIRVEDLMRLWNVAGPHLRRFEFSRSQVRIEPFSWNQSNDFLTITNIPEVIQTIERRSELSSARELQQLELVDLRGMEPDIQYAIFVAQTPRLRRLKWKLHDTTRSRPSVFTIMELDPQPWAELESIDITSDKKTETLPDQLLATLLDRIGNRLRRLVLCGLTLGRQTLQALPQHFGHVAWLDLGNCSTASGSLVQQILTSSPALEHIFADAIYIEDVLEDGKPWVCLGLRTWAVPINLSSRQKPAPSSTVSESSRNQELVQAQVDDSEASLSPPSSLSAQKHLQEGDAEEDDNEHIQRQSRTVFKRLSSLTKLKQIDLERRYSSRAQGWRPVEALDWRLKAGLGLLESLTEMERIRFMSRQNMSNMSKSAVIWMIKHWLNLKVVQGRIGSRKAEFKDLRLLFWEGGISVETGE